MEQADVVVENVVNTAQAVPQQGSVWGNDYVLSDHFRIAVVLDGKTKQKTYGRISKNAGFVKGW